MVIHRKILIIGAGVHAQVILDILSYDLNNEIIGFTDKDKRKHNSLINGIPVIGDDSVIPKLIKNNEINSIIIGLGYELIEKEKFFIMKLIN